MAHHVDPNQLQNAVLNLAVNARDAMPDGGNSPSKRPTVTSMTDTADYTKVSRPAESVMLSITDTGTGMSADVVCQGL